MKKLLQISSLVLFVLLFSSCAASSKNEVVKKDNMQKSETGPMAKKTTGLNIDKNNVANTLMEEPDQRDPELIEGNLEDNDLKTN